MLTYILRRLLIIPMILLGVSLLIFSIISMMKPIDRAQAMFPAELSDRNRSRDFAGLVKKFGLDDPIHIQYWRWMAGKEDPETGEFVNGVLQGNLGWSQVGRSAVTEVIARRGPATLELILWTTVPMVLLGIWMGVVAAVRHNQVPDHVLRLFAVIGWSVPSFIFGLLLILYFSSELHWFPPGRLTIDTGAIVQSDAFINYTNMHSIDALLNLRFDIFKDALIHLVLPVITLAAANWAFLVRITRFSMLETLNQDYITTARSKGISERSIVKKHALPNALNPVVTVGGLTLVSMFNNVVITEAIFNYPGLGSFLADAAISLDLVSVAGITLFTSFVLIIGNLVVDILYVIIDPRVQLN